MIVYSAQKKQFMDDVASNIIHQKIVSEFKIKLGKRVADNEVSSWRNSMQYMRNVLDDDAIPHDAGVSIEFNIPLTNKRIDFILTGENSARTETAIIIELKQWSSIRTTPKDAVVKTYLGRREIETSHPSYQAWTYAALICDFNQTVRDEKIALRPCAYLHNMDSHEAINHEMYSKHTDKAPVFISSDAKQLSEFLKTHVRYGDANNIMYRIEHGKIKPSKSLADCLASMLQGNTEFLMIDDQKLVYETALQLAHRSQRNDETRKQVLIVEGGPGTGKSVVAINLLVELTQREMTVQYVSKNAAPRAVYQAVLTGSFNKSHINNLFKGSGSYTETQSNSIDVLLADEAHRLNEKSGIYSNKGENQIKEIINAAKLSVFFIDEAQRVTMKDIGSQQKIQHWANSMGAEVHKLALQSQFRCNGSDGYLAWLDNTLQIRETVNSTLGKNEFDFQVFDNPAELKTQILKKNHRNNKARLVAGYCWDWASKKEPSAMDIEFPESGFSAQWNLDKDGSLWIVAPNSVHEVGCIHTCQGLEVDYIGVIIGPDLIVRDGQIMTDGAKRSKMDASIRGYKKLLKENPGKASQQADEIIKNTYRTLMTRGQKGCYIYSVDAETNAYFKSLLIQDDVPETVSDKPQEKFPDLSLKLLPSDTVKPYVNAVPIYDLEIAAGEFSVFQNIEDVDWVELPEPFTAQPGYFVTRVVGESMNKRIPNGAWCLFKFNPGGTRNGKVVLVGHRAFEDPDYGGAYTIKRYESIKHEYEEGLNNSFIVLKPDSYDPSYSDITIEEDQFEQLRVIGEMIAVLV